MDMSNWIAMGAGFALTLVIGWFLIPYLRKLKAGQLILLPLPSVLREQGGTLPKGLWQKSCL